MNSDLFAVAWIVGAMAAMVFIVIASTLVRERHSTSEEIRRTHRPLKITLVGLALVMGGMGFYSNALLQQAAAMTLFETEVLGSAGTKVGEDAPVRELTFEVEHPGAEHQLVVIPQSNTEPEGAVEIVVRLVDGQEHILLSNQHTHPVRRSRRSASTWSSNTLAFTPKSRGQHTLLVAPLTVGIPTIFVRIEDPQKRDGRRMER